MQYRLVASNPFAVLTAIVARPFSRMLLRSWRWEPATGWAALWTARASSRAAWALTNLVPSEHQEWTKQLRDLQLRARMLLRALRMFYAALGLFAASALVSVAGSIATYYSEKIVFAAAAAFAIVTGASAVAGLAIGCTVMVQEAHLAVQSLEATRLSPLKENAALRNRIKRKGCPIKRLLEHCVGVGIQDEQSCVAKCCCRILSLLQPSVHGAHQLRRRRGITAKALLAQLTNSTTNANRCTSLFFFA
jgi:hypothetical protein